MELILFSPTVISEILLNEKAKVLMVSVLKGFFKHAEHLEAHMWGFVLWDLCPKRPIAKLEIWHMICAGTVKQALSISLV